MVLGLRERLNAGIRLFNEDSYAAAEKQLLAVVQDGSKSIRARTMLGIICAKTGRIGDAQQRLEAALSLDPGNFDALVWMAAVRVAQNDLSGAIGFLQRALQSEPDDACTLYQLGLYLLEASDWEGAANAFRRTIELEPRSSEAYYHLGMALHSLSISASSYEAFQAFKRAAELNPENPWGHIRMFNQMQLLMNWNEGLPTLEEGLRRNPEVPQMASAVATTYGKLGYVAEADDLFRSAWSTDPVVGPAYARWLHEVGQFSASAEILQQTIRQDPDRGISYYSLTEVNCFELDGAPLTERIPALLDQGLPTPEDRMYLLFALAKSFDHRKDYQEAMRCYDEANDLAFQVFNCQDRFHIDEVAAETRALHQAFSEDAYNRLAMHGSSSDVPIFVIGMIRSGTTLLDQILSSHPLIRSAGEQPFWISQINPAILSWRSGLLDGAGLRGLANDYLDVLHRAAGESPRITDKMPLNYQHLGLIRAAFPKARIIHLRRNPLDTALSTYTTFLGHATNFVYSKRNIVNNYLIYLRTMDYWRSILPSDRFCEVDYEDLVSSNESVVRDVIEFCGLEWDEACLSHESNKAAVDTPSFWAVRQPVNSRSVGKWRRYEPWLGELMELAKVSHPLPK